MKNLLFVLVAFVLTTSCGKEDSKEKSPCSFLNEAEIKETLSLPEEAPTTMEDKMYTQPTCTYEWKTITYKRILDIGGQKITIDEPYKLMIVLVAGANEAMFEQSTSVYKDGENINGLGEIATWGEGMSQVSFLSGGYLVHLHLKTSSNNGDNRDKAIELAKLVEERL